jgi:hypothetical protein
VRSSCFVAHWVGKLGGFLAYLTINLIDFLPSPFILILAFRPVVRGKSMVFQRTNIAVPEVPDDTKRPVPLREMARPEVTHLQEATEGPTTNASSLEPESPMEVVTNTNVLVQQVAALSVTQLENVISDLQGLRAFLHSEGERIQQEISSYLKLSQTTIGSAKVIADSIPRWKKLPDGTA